jgi:TfoX/Sxy family transcriptional regulator of competence genes
MAERVTVPKPTDADKDWFVDLLPADKDVTKRPMFGNLGGFVNGNLFMASFGPTIALRLDEAARQELMAEGGTPFAPMPSRPMKEYVVLPPQAREDQPMARAWIARALEHTRAMPAKQPKPKKK